MQALVTFNDAAVYTTYVFFLLLSFLLLLCFSPLFIVVELNVTTKTRRPTSKQVWSIELSER